MRRIIILAGIATVFGSGLLIWTAHCAGGNEERVPVRDPEHRVQVRIPSWKELRQRNVVMQRRDYSCGAAALATLLRYYWDSPTTEEDVLVVLLKMLTAEETKDRIKNGLAISDLRRAAVKMGYLSSIGTMTFEKLTEARVPLIVPIRLQKYDHFVVYRGVADGRVYLADPIRGNVRPTVAEFRCQWQKNAVLAVAKPGAKLPDWSPLSIRPDEVVLGETADQFIRRELPGRLMPPVP